MRGPGPRPPSLAGPKRPQDRIELGQVEASLPSLFRPNRIRQRLQPPGRRHTRHQVRGNPTLAAPPRVNQPDGRAALWRDGGQQAPRWPAARRTDSRSTAHQGKAVGNGDVLIAAITSCTNTSNPSVMLAAGLLAQKAVEKPGLQGGAHIKTIAGARLARRHEYLTANRPAAVPGKAGLCAGGLRLHHLHRQRRDLTPGLNEAITSNDLVCAAGAVRQPQFEARIHPNLKANFWSPAAGGGLRPLPARC